MNQHQDANYFIYILTIFFFLVFIKLKMGCSFCNRSSEKIDHNSIDSIEDGLQLSNLPSNFLDSMFHSHSREKTMTLAQFQRGMNELKLDYDKYCLFYNLFIDQNLAKYNVMVFSVQKLSTLGILLGTCLDREKLKLLFQNYDINASKTLTRSEIECLVTDILDISIIYIPKYAYSVLNTPNMKRHVDGFEAAFDLVKAYFINAILGELSEISLRAFLKISNDQSKIIIIKSKQLREVS